MAVDEDERQRPTREHLELHSIRLNDEQLQLVSRGVAADDDHGGGEIGEMKGEHYEMADDGCEVLGDLDGEGKGKLTERDYKLFHLLIFGVYATNVLGQDAVIPCVPLIQEDLGFSSATIALVASFQDMGMVSGKLIHGWLIDALGPRRLMFYTFMALSMFLFALSFASNFGLFALLMACISFVGSATDPAEVCIIGNWCAGNAKQLSKDMYHCIPTGACLCIIHTSPILIVGVAVLFVMIIRNAAGHDVEMGTSTSVFLPSHRLCNWREWRGQAPIEGFKNNTNRSSTKQEESIAAAAFKSAKTLSITALTHFIVKDTSSDRTRPGRPLSLTALLSAAKLLFKERLFWGAACVHSAAATIRRMDVILGTVYHDITGISPEDAAALVVAFPLGVILGLLLLGTAFRRLKRGAKQRLLITGMWGLVVIGCLGLMAVAAHRSKANNNNPDDTAAGFAGLFVFLIGVGVSVPYYMAAYSYAAAHGGKSIGLSAALIEAFAFCVAALILGGIISISGWSVAFFVLSGVALTGEF
eukprot:jgi/Bigna1/86700/estExt_fgenesh1_pg.C_120283